MDIKLDIVFSPGCLGPFCSRDYGLTNLGIIVYLRQTHEFLTVIGEYMCHGEAMTWIDQASPILLDLRC